MTTCLRHNLFRTVISFCFSRLLGVDTLIPDFRNISLSRSVDPVLHRLGGKSFLGLDYLNVPSAPGIGGVEKTR